jgi:stage II sporulation protein D
MNWIGKIFCLFSFFCSVSLILADEKLSSPLVPSSAKDVSDQKRNYHVRVLLQEADSSEKLNWKISSTHGFMLIDPEEKTKKALAENELIITWKKNCFYLNDTLCDTKRLYLSPSLGHLKFNGKEYQGSFLIVQKNDCIYLINSIDIEDYVFSVLRTESWPGWPLEVNKVFAIASRSYVIGVIINNRSSALPYHVKNTNKHQTYSGVHADPILKEAVNQTRGLFLAFNKKPIVAMFDACCGGVVPGHIHGMNFSHAPYLARNYACGFCKEAKNYSWTAHYTFDQFEQLLKKEFKNINRIKAVKIVKTDKAGLAQQIQIKGHHKSYSISGKKLYSMLSKVRSFCFEIAVNANQVIFQGKGIGHHMGLCQWGAREMVRQGYDYKAILNFYYPDTHFMRLYA